MTTNNPTPHSWSRRGPADPRYKTKEWQILRARLLAQTTLCALCHHENARSIDHIEPVELAPERFYDLDNLQVMHGTKSKCEECATASGGLIKGDCQSIKGSLPIETARQRLSKRTGINYSPWPYKTVQEAIDHLSPLVGEDYELVCRMINDGAPCDRRCDCGGQDAASNGRCLDAMFDAESARSNNRR